ncbi:MAG: LPS export ABC transporter periplasmic protein LptC [Bdellovibrionales bacterium]|nr:LPS export ABC transporter periplasmic protein LptC [Bdellovibrionales bacterium]
MNISRLIFGLFLLLIFVEIVLIAPKNLDDISMDFGPLNSQTEEDTNKIDQIMKGVHLVEASSGKKDWELWAESAQSLKVQKTWQLFDVKANISASDGQVFNITGDKGFVEVQSKNLKIEGNVRVRSENGYVFKSSVAFYDAQKKLIHGDQPVELAGPKKSSDAINMQGDRFKIDVVSLNMTLLENVKGNYTTPERSKVRILSEEAIFSSKNKDVFFNKNVVIRSNNKIVQGPKAHFIYNKNKSKIDKLVMTGGVSIKDLDKKAVANTVEAFLDEQKFVLRGNPRVTQGEDEMVGDEIIFLEGGKRVKVKKANIKASEERLEDSN